MTGIQIIGIGAGISGTGHSAYLVIKSRRAWYLAVADPCSLMGASQSYEVMAPQQSLGLSLSPFAPAVRPKLVPPWTTYMAKEWPFEHRNLYSWRTLSSFLPPHFSVQWVIQPVQIQPPKIIPFFQKDLTLCSCSGFEKSLMPMLAPSQWHFSIFYSQSTQYQRQFIPISCHMSRMACMQDLSVPQKPYSFSICSMTMHLLGCSLVLKCSFMIGNRAWKYYLVSARNCGLLARIQSPSTVQRRAGIPPRSHSAQTQGPGRNSTITPCFSASCKKRGRFLLPVEKSQTPLAVSWQFHIMYTLSALRPKALIIRILCSQYSTGMRLQCTSPAQILPNDSASLFICIFNY